MKKYLKHLMAVAVCLVVAVGLFAGCTANLGTELTADADVETAKTYVIEAVEATKAYTDGFKVTLTADSDMKMDGSEYSTKMNGEVASTGEKAYSKTEISVKLNSKGSSTNLEMQSDSYWGKVGDDFVKYDKNSEEKYVYETELEFESDLPEFMDSLLGAGTDMETGAEVLEFLFEDLNFEVLDEEEDLSYKLYKVSDSEYNFVLKVDMTEGPQKTEMEITIGLKDGKVSSITMAAKMFSDEREDGAEEAVWESAGSAKITINVQYEVKDFTIASASAIEDYEETSWASSVGPSIGF